MNKTLNRHHLDIVLVNTWRVINAKGGTEKVFCMMANEFVRRGHKVTAICIDENNGNPGFPIDQRVNFVNAFKNKVPLMLSKIMRKIRSLSISGYRRKANRAKLEFQIYGYKLKKELSNYSPDVIISFQAETTYTLKKIIGDSTPIITMFHGVPTAYSKELSIPEIATAVEQSSIVQVLRPEFINIALKYISHANIKVIPNCVPQFKYSSSLSTKTVITIGRFSPEKRQILQIRAFALIKDKFPEWTLELWGETVDSEYTKKIKATIQECNVTNRVKICGTTDNVPKQLAQASIFFFPSKFEGFPLALTEAMSMGLPAIGCKECPSVNTLIRDGENGLLCDDTPESLAEALSKLMSDESLRVRLGNVAKEDMKTYAPERVWDQWENLFYSVCAHSQRKRSISN